MKRGISILAVVTALLLSLALYEALIGAPTERTMGDVQRIFYYHVPSAWTAFLLFLINFIASIVYLIRRNPKTDILALVSAEVGVVFCTVVIVTGPIWARPVWGIWWAAGDIRLTTTLVLWLIYISYLVLRRFSTSGQTPVIAAVLAIFAATLAVPGTLGHGQCRCQDLRRVGCAARVLFHLVFPYPASLTCDRRWRVA